MNCDPCSTALWKSKKKETKHFISGDLRWHHFTCFVFGVIEQLVHDATAVASLFFSALFCSVILSNVLLTNTTNYFAYGASVRRKNTAGIHNRQERTKHSRVAGKWQNRLLTTIITQQCVLGVFLLLLSLPLSTCLQPHYLLLHPSYVRPSPW